MRIVRHAHRSGSGGFSWSRAVYLAAIAGAWLLTAGHADADGCFVFGWNKEKDINEPTQKAIILHDKGREDMVLQVKYEGPAEDFGWLIPVPGLPEVRKGSMDCFYELSRLTQERFGFGKYSMVMSIGTSRGMSADAGVKVIKVKTVGAYEVTVLSATNGASLGAWLESNHFTFPKEKQDVLDGYIKKQWYFVAAKIDPSHNGFLLQHGSPKKGPDRKAISPSTRKKLAGGELHPLVISFPSEECMFPLAISAVNGKSSEVSLYVLSSEPLASREILDKKLAAESRKRAKALQTAIDGQKQEEANRKALDDLLDKHIKEYRQRREEHPNDPRLFGGGRAIEWTPWDNDPDDPEPGMAIRRRSEGIVFHSMKDFLSKGLHGESEDGYYGGSDLVESMEAGPKDLRACSKEMPRLAAKSWWLTKQVEVFAPEEMRDLEFEPAVSILAGKLREADGQAAASCLPQFGARVIPVLLASSKSSNPIERKFAASAMGRMQDGRLPEAVSRLLGDTDEGVRRNACYAAARNWDASFSHRVAELLYDSDEEVRAAAIGCLRAHPDDSQIPVYKKIVEEDRPGAYLVFTLLPTNTFSRKQLVHILSSTNYFVLRIALGQLRSQSLERNEFEPLLTNSLPIARVWGLARLTKVGDKEAVDRMVAMLRDPDEYVRWDVRARLRHLTGQNLGPDPAAYEKWWAENKNDFAPHPPSVPGLEKH